MSAVTDATDGDEDPRDSPSSAAAATKIAVDRRCFRKGSFDADDLTEPLGKLGIGSGGARIRCPECRWVPRRSDRWQCVCSHLWHAFDTRGRCPECSNPWHVMQCLKCAKWSAHAAWYA